MQKPFGTGASLYPDAICECIIPSNTAKVPLLYYFSILCLHRILLCLEAKIINIAFFCFSFSYYVSDYLFFNFETHFSLVFTAVIATMTKRCIWLTDAYQTLSLREVNIGAQSWALEAGAEANHGRKHFLAHSPWLVQSTFLYYPGSPAQGWHHSKLSGPTHINY